MRESWPDALGNNLLDDSLASDFLELGELTTQIFERFLTLGRYAAMASDGRIATGGILFTCSAFGPAIERVKADLAIPVVAPNEGAFYEALDICQSASAGGRVGLVHSLQGTLALLIGELTAIAASRGQKTPDIVSVIATGALPAMQRGDTATHDRVVAEAAAQLPPVDVIVLSQFSMARAAPEVRAVRTEPVLASPAAAVRRLKALVLGR